MRDVEIWLRLWPSTEHLEPSIDELIAGLAEIAAVPLGTRAGLLGHAYVHREHPDLRVRAGVMTALAGVTGIQGLRALVAGLDDDAAEVRIAAADALIASSRIGQSIRLLHALFHPRDDVRRHVVARVPVALQWVGAYLREDPICAELVREWPLRSGLRLALDLHARGLASDTELCTSLANVEDGELIEILRYSPRRSRAELDDARRWLAGEGPAPAPCPAGIDVLDRIVAAIDACGFGRALQPLVRTSRTADAGERMQVAIVLRLLARDRIADPLLTFAVRHDPNLLAAELVPLRWRKAAARLNAKAGGRSRSEPALAHALLYSPLVREPDGSLDLATAASVAWLLPGPQYGRLLAALGLPVVIAALEREDNSAGFAALCELPEPSAELREEYPELDHSPLDLLPALALGHHARLHAIALASWVGQRSRVQALLDSLAQPQLRACVVTLLCELDGVTVTMTDKLAQRLAWLIADAVDEVTRFELIAALLEQPGLRPLAAAVVERLLRDAEPNKLVLFVHASGAERLLRLIRWLREGVLLPIEVEQRIAKQLGAHASAEVRAAATLLVAPSLQLPERAALASLHRLTTAEADVIASCGHAQLGTALASALAGPSQGLVHALGRRRAQPSIEACLALLGAHDPISAVAERFAEHFDATDPAFERELTEVALARWQHNAGLGPIGNAWLHAFEQHATKFGEWLLSEPMLAQLERCAGLASPILRVACFEAVAGLFVRWRYRNPTLLATLALDGLPTRLVGLLDTELGPAAAKLLVSLHLGERCKAELARVHAEVLLLAPDLDRVTRHELHRWARIDGLPERETAERAGLVLVRPDLLAELRASEDLDQLARGCEAGSVAIVEEAALRLVELGPAGEARLAQLLAGSTPPPRADRLVHTVALWSSSACVEQVRGLLSQPSVDPHLRFRLALALVERGESDQLAVALAVAVEPMTGESWLRGADWQQLAAHLPPAELAAALTVSPHPHAYQRAVEWLLAQPRADERLEPLRGFLRAGTQRPTQLRRRVAAHLGKDPVAVPVLLHAMLDPDNGQSVNPWLWQLDPDTRAQVLDAAVSAALIGGPEAASERRVASLLDARVASPGVIRRLFLDCVDDTVRTQLAQNSTSPQWRRTALDGIAVIFAWGVRRGRELTGRLFRVQMTDKRQDFGYTMLDEDRIFVSPLPFFAGDRHGREIVEALILHELGHHVHHRGPQAAEIWQRAQKRRLHGVLNLVADEHLERNLRSLRTDYGDRLKRLAAHAFLHAERDLDWTWLLDRLGAASFRILSTKPTTPAHKPGQVRIHRGDLMQALEAGGSSWARFARALRMGLGDRWGDPKVQAGLELFKPSPNQFRHADMAELWRITEALARLFADELPLAEVLGGQETLGDAEREGTASRHGIGDEEVQKEVERVLDPRELGRSERKGGPSRLAINVGPDEQFDRITEVRRVPRDPDKHQQVAREVARHAQRMRAFLCDLGLDLVPRGARLRGRSFDRTRTQAVVLRRDPRMLIARELEIRSDLFVGVLIDCSGSMSTGNLLATATRFAVLIAEAVRGLPGVDARFWGFTDSVIWDAGDADRCAVTSLATSGGNNDAAALLHAAEIAADSRRKAKILVMISDGLPTQCSVSALRSLVIRLGRKQLVCAQVAVRPLEEVCFPHYVLLADQPIELATLRFGELVSKLARQALGR